MQAGGAFLPAVGVNPSDASDACSGVTRVRNVLAASPITKASHIPLPINQSDINPSLHPPPPPPPHLPRIDHPPPPRLERPTPEVVKHVTQVSADQARLICVNCGRFIRLTGKAGDARKAQRFREAPCQGNALVRALACRPSAKKAARIVNVDASPPSRESRPSPELPSQSGLGSTASSSGINNISGIVASSSAAGSLAAARPTSDASPSKRPRFLDRQRSASRPPPERSVPPAKRPRIAGSEDFKGVVPIHNVQRPKRVIPTSEFAHALGAPKRRLRPHTRFVPPSTPAQGNPWENDKGHHLLKTERYLWCCKCGAMVTLGGDARYLRGRCADSPPTPQLIRQRDSLLAGMDPYSGLPLSQRASVVANSRDSEPPGRPVGLPGTLAPDLPNGSSGSSSAAACSNEQADLAVAPNLPDGLSGSSDLDACPNGQADAPE